MLLKRLHFKSAQSGGYIDYIVTPGVGLPTPFNGALRDANVAR
jgi:hypothetical protein